MASSFSLPATTLATAGRKGDARERQSSQHSRGIFQASFTSAQKSTTHSQPEPQSAGSTSENNQIHCFDRSDHLPPEPRGSCAASSPRLHYRICGGSQVYGSSAVSTTLHVAQTGRDPKIFSYERPHEVPFSLAYLLSRAGLRVYILQQWAPSPDSVAEVAGAPPFLPPNRWS